MAAVLTPADGTEFVVGEPIAISGTGFGATATVHISITTQEESEDVTYTVVAASGAWALPGTFTPDVPGMYMITAEDGTNTETSTVKVSQG